MFNYLTFSKHPTVGDVAALGTLDRDPNVIRFEIYKRIKEKAQKESDQKKQINIENCSQCLEKYSYKNKPNLEDGYYKNNSFMPSNFIMLDNKRYPIMMQNRLGGLPFILIKKMKEIFDYKTALIYFQYISIVALIILIAIALNRIYSSTITNLTLVLLSFTPSFLFNNAEFPVIKLLPMVLPLTIIGLTNKRKITQLTVLSLTFSCFYLIKANAIFYIICGLILTFKKRSANYKTIATALIIAFIPTIFLFTKQNLAHEYVGQMEYFKGYKYLLSIIFDMFLLIGDSSVAEEFILGVSSWNYPFTTGVPTLESYSNFNPFIRFKDINFASIILIFFFTLPLLLKKFKTNKEYLSLYIAALFFTTIHYLASHHYYTFTPYIWSVLLLTTPIFSLMINDLYKHKRYIGLGALLLIVSLKVFNTTNFVKTYREYGPIPNFNVNLYQRISDDLISNGIYNPYMLYISEWGLLEAIDQRVTPTHIPDYFIYNYDDIFNLTPKGYFLLQLNPNWHERKWQQSINRKQILSYAKENEIEIEDIKTYQFRGKDKYWLFYFRNRKEFYDEDIKLPSTRYEYLIETYKNYR